IRERQATVLTGPLGAIIRLSVGAVQVAWSLTCQTGRVSGYVLTLNLIKNVAGRTGRRGLAHRSCFTPRAAPVTFEGPPTFCLNPPTHGSTILGNRWKTGSNQK